MSGCGRQHHAVALLMLFHQQGTTT